MVDPADEGGDGHRVVHRRGPEAQALPGLVELLGERRVHVEVAGRDRQVRGLERTAALLVDDVERGDQPDVLDEVRVVAGTAAAIEVGDERRPADGREDEVGAPEDDVPVRVAGVEPELGRRGPDQLLGVGRVEADASLESVDPGAGRRERVEHAVAEDLEPDLGQDPQATRGGWPRPGRPRGSRAAGTGSSGGATEAARPSRRSGAADGDGPQGRAWRRRSWRRAWGRPCRVMVGAVTGSDGACPGRGGQGQSTADPAQCGPIRWRTDGLAATDRRTTVTLIQEGSAPRRPIDAPDARVLLPDERGTVRSPNRGPGLGAQRPREPPSYDSGSYVVTSRTACADGRADAPGSHGYLRVRAWNQARREPPVCATTCRGLAATAASGWTRRKELP